MSYGSATVPPAFAYPAEQEAQQDDPESTAALAAHHQRHTWGMSASQCLGASVLGKLQHRSLPIWSSRLHNDVLGILNGDDHTSSQLQLLPCLAQIHHEDAIRSSSVDISLHLEVTVLGAEMALRRQHQLDIGLFLRQCHAGRWSPKKLWGCRATSPQLVAHKGRRPTHQSARSWMGTRHLTWFMHVPAHVCGGPEQISDTSLSIGSAARISRYTPISYLGPTVQLTTSLHTFSRTILLVNPTVYLYTLADLVPPQVVRQTRDQSLSSCWLDKRPHRLIGPLDCHDVSVKGRADRPAAIHTGWIVDCVGRCPCCEYLI